MYKPLFICLSTILVEPGCTAQLTEKGDVCISVGTDTQCVVGTELNAIQLSIFSHRFMSIAGVTPGEGGMEWDIWKERMCLNMRIKN